MINSDRIMTRDKITLIAEKDIYDGSRFHYSMTISSYKFFFLLQKMV